MELDDVCSFGRGVKQIFALDLKAKEKYWLGREIVDRRQTCANLVKKYQLSKSTLYSYADAYKNGIVLHDGPGRPGVLSPVEEERTGRETETRRLNLFLVSRRTRRRIESKLALQATVSPQPKVP